MAYIPEKHKQYDILPWCREKGGEVLVYDGKMFDQIQNKGCDLSFPYGIKSYEEYYGEIDACMIKYPHLRKLLQDYKEDLLVWNNKDVWGIVRYNGENNSSFTKGRCYYVPIGKEDDNLLPGSGVIDDEEFTAYECWDLSGQPHKTTDVEGGFSAEEDIRLERPRFEIILDPSGRLKRYFPGNEEKCFIVFAYHGKKNTLLGISDLN